MLAQAWNNARRGTRGLPPPVKLESRHIPFTVLVRHKIRPKNLTGHIYNVNVMIPIHFFMNVWSNIIIFFLVTLFYLNDEGFLYVCCSLSYHNSQHQRYNFICIYNFINYRSYFLYYFAFLCTAVFFLFVFLAIVQ